MSASTTPDKQPLAFGSWPSPLSAAGLGSAAKRLAFPLVDGDRVFWVEGRPQEAGRSVVVCDDGTGPQDWVAAPLSVRSRVHEYGGSAFTVHGHIMWFVADNSGQVYETTASGPCRAVTKPGQWRLGDLTYDPKRNRLLAVGERHEDGHSEPTNAILAIDLSTANISVLIQGHDFFAAPRIDPLGERLAYLAWDHPHLPWDAAALFVVSIDQHGGASIPQHIAGNEHASAFGPTWSPDGSLAFAWEQTGFWNVYVWRPEQQSVAAVTVKQAEFALPLWQLGMSTFAWLNKHTLAVAFTTDGRWQVGTAHVITQELHLLTSELPSISHLHAHKGRIVVVGAAPDMPSAIVEVKLDGSFQVLQHSLILEPEVRACVSAPRAIDYATGNAQTAHAFFYPPFHAHHVGLNGEKPPLLVIVHGGPTAATAPAFNPGIQFWTTRGFAVLDVNYRGSTGYGRAYRALLDGRWGIADVEDCVAGAQQAAREGLVDLARMAIHGSSAGGFTALAAITFHNVFAAGASLYGVADLEALVKDTHKFESHYLDRLVGPYPADVAVYRERSPLHAADKLNTPVIFFQGQQDKVVPPSQTEAMVSALRTRGVHVDYLVFEGEQHGFRKAETITKVYEAELSFYANVFRFTASA